MSYRSFGRNERGERFAHFVRVYTRPRVHTKCVCSGRLRPGMCLAHVTLLQVNAQGYVDNNARVSVYIDLPVPVTST